MSRTLAAAALKLGDRYMSTAHDNREVEVVETPAKVDDNRIIVSVRDTYGMTWRTILRADRVLEAPEVLDAESVVFFSVAENQWTTTDGLAVCQDHATPLPCLFCGGAL